MEDTKIISMFWNRDEKAIQETDRKYHHFCYKIAWRLLMNNEDSEECVNDTWFAAWNHIPPHRPAFLSAFLGKITRGFAINRIRKSNAGKRVDTHIIAIKDEVLELNHAAARCLDEHIEAEELVRIINHFLETLSERDRDIFVSRYWSMRSIREITVRHKMTEGAVKQNLLRNRRKLQKILEKEGYFYEP